MSKIIAKRVELSELFYDLVFVYAISNTTNLIHHIHEPSQFFVHFLTFSLVMIVFINTWMIETVFTNRYGENSVKNILYFMVNMAILLFMSNTFSGDISSWFKPFALATALMTFTLVLQYTGIYLHAASSVDKQISRAFIFILMLRTLCIFIGALLPQRFGIPLAILGVLISWLLPGFFTSLMKNHPINFPHLLERITALSIIVFGETIIGISMYFTKSTLTIFSIGVFILVCALFMTYITQFDHYIEENQANETGVKLIYLHYPIIFGISLVTVALAFVHEESLSKNFALFCLYFGIILFYIGIFIASYYNKKELKLSLKLPMIFAAILLISFITSFILPFFEVIILATTSATFINAFIFSYYMVHHRNIKQKNEPRA